MKIDTWACDICKIQKKETNHWFRGLELDSCSPDEKPVRCIQILPWEAKLPETVECSHLCGIECVMKWCGRELAKLSGTICDVMEEV